MNASAIYHPETDTFTLSGAQWSNSYPIAELGQWLDFYTRMKVDFPKSGSSYDDTITALEGLKHQLGQ